MSTDTTITANAPIASTPAEVTLTPEQEERLGGARQILDATQSELRGRTLRETVGQVMEAIELLARYSIEGALQEIGTNGKPAGERIIEILKPYPRQRVDLLCSIATEVGCATVIKQKAAGRADLFEVHIVGAVEDLERIDLLWPALLMIASHGVDNAAVPAGQGAKSYKRAWLMGFSVDAASRLRAVEQKVRDEYANARRKGDLPLETVVDARRDDVEIAVEEIYPEVEEAQFIQTTCPTGFIAGLVATSDLPPTEGATDEAPVPADPGTEEAAEATTESANEDAKEEDTDTPPAA